MGFGAFKVGLLSPGLMDLNDVYWRAVGPISEPFALSKLVPNYHWNNVRRSFCPFAPIVVKS